MRSAICDVGEKKKWFFFVVLIAFCENIPTFEMYWIYRMYKYVKMYVDTAKRPENNMKNKSNVTSLIILSKNNPIRDGVY